MKCRENVFFIFIIALSLCNWQPGFADPLENGVVGKVLPHLKKIYADNFIELRSDINITNPAAITAKIKEAYDFDQATQALNSPILSKPIIVGLYSPAVYEKFGGNAAGTQVYVASIQPFLNYVNNSDDRGFGWFVTAHELEHLLMNRMKAPVEKMPAYLFEGIACSLGYRYACKTQEGPFSLRIIAGRLKDYTYSDARKTLHDLRKVSDYASVKEAGLMWQGEHIGGLFFEFLIARVYKSADTVFYSWGKVISDLGNGIPFEIAYKSRFGMTLQQSEIAFLNYVGSTENDPVARFKGTVLEGR